MRFISIFIIMLLLYGYGNPSLASDEETGSEAVTNEPLIALIGGDLVIEQFSVFEDPGVTVLSPVLYVVNIPNVNTNIIGNYTVSYSASNGIGNSDNITTELVRNVTVIKSVDTVPPLIIFFNNADTVELGSNYTYDKAVIDLDNDIDIHIEDTLNTNQVGSYTITVTATDSSNNSSTASINVNVIDTVAPLIFFDADTTIELGSNYTYGSAVFDLDNDVDVRTENTLDTDQVGSYTITVTATDSSNNSSTESITFDVILGPDTIDSPPVIALNGGDVTIEVGTKYIDAGVTVTDKTSASFTTSTDSSVNTDEVGTYTVTYTATDDLSTSTAVRNVTVVRTILAEEDFESYENDAYPDQWGYFVSHQSDLNYDPSIYLNAIKVQSDDTNSGQKAVNLINESDNSPVQITYELDPSQYEGSLYVRMYMKQSIDIGRSVESNHATLVSLRGSSGNNDAEVRFGDARGVLGVTVNPSAGIAPVYGKQAAQLSSDELSLAPQINKDEWHCLELAFLDEGEQSQMFAWNNDELVFSVESTDDFELGGPTDSHWLSQFMHPEEGNPEIVIGWQSWDAGINENILVDDIIISTERVGCDL